MEEICFLGYLFFVIFVMGPRYLSYIIGNVFLLRISVPTLVEWTFESQFAVLPICLFLDQLVDMQISAFDPRSVEVHLEYQMWS